MSPKVELMGGLRDITSFLIAIGSRHVRFGPHAFPSAYFSSHPPRPIVAFVEKRQWNLAYTFLKDLLSKL